MSIYYNCAYHSAPVEWLRKDGVNAHEADTRPFDTLSDGEGFEPSERF